MAWQDILGGLAGGLSQGLGQVQQNVESSRRNDQVNKEMALRALQERRAMEAEARQAAVAQYNAMEEGFEQDPTALADIIKHVGAGAFVKGPKGGLMRKPNTAKLMADAQFEEWKLGALERASAREISAKKLALQQQAVQMMEQKHGPDWMNKIQGREKSIIGALLFNSNEALLGEHEKASVISSGISAAGAVKAAGLQAEAMKPLRQANIDNLANDNSTALNAQFTQWLGTAEGQLATMRFPATPEGAQQLQQYYLKTRQATGLLPSPSKYTFQQP